MPRERERERTCNMKEGRSVIVNPVSINGILGMVGERFCTIVQFGSCVGATHIIRRSISY